MIDTIGRDCCGCGACAASCPQSCITMVKNEEGFLYPIIDKKSCINCSLCEVKCPVDNKIRCQSIRKGFLVRNKDRRTLIESASGGFFSALVLSVDEENRVFCGATFDFDWNVTHKLSSSLEDLKVMRGSKYVQSNIGHCYESIKNCLNNNTRVIFCGTPCQVQALKKYLGLLSSSDLLFTVDIVCKGVGSPGLWAEYLQYQKAKYNSNIVSLNFRKKVHGYHSSNMVVQFRNGKKSSKSKTDLFIRAYVNELCSRDCCYDCHFKGVDRCSDFTVFDAWNSEKLIGIKDDDKGYTTVVAHNQRAVNRLQEMYELLEIYEIDLNRAIGLDGTMLINQPKKHEKKTEFLVIGNSRGIENATDSFFKVTTKENIIEFSKSILYSLGLLQMAKSINKKIQKK